MRTLLRNVGVALAHVFVAVVTLLLALLYCGIAIAGMAVVFGLLAAVTYLVFHFITGA